MMGGHVAITVGYIAAIIGGAILFMNTPPDVGGTHVLMIPRSSGDADGLERKAIASRRTRNRIGFALISLGSASQLAGYWVDKVPN